MQKLAAKTGREYCFAIRLSRVIIPKERNLSAKTFESLPRGAHWYSIKWYSENSYFIRGCSVSILLTSCFEIIQTSKSVENFYVTKLVDESKSLKDGGHLHGDNKLHMLAFSIHTISNRKAGNI